MADLLRRMFHDKVRNLWVRLTDYKYPRTALLLPKKYQKEALCEAHNSIFGGHDANLKTYENLIVILLARIVQGCQEARPNLPHLSAKKTVHHQANATTAAANSGTPKLEDPCRFIRAHVDSGQQ